MTGYLHCPKTPVMGPKGEHQSLGQMHVSFLDSPKDNQNTNLKGQKRALQDSFSSNKRECYITLDKMKHMHGYTEAWSFPHLTQVRNCSKMIKTKIKVLQFGASPKVIHFRKLVSTQIKRLSSWKKLQGLIHEHKTVTRTWYNRQLVPLLRIRYLCNSTGENMPQRILYQMAATHYSNDS